MNEKKIRIAERGKTERKLIDADGKVCLRGALYLAQAEIDNLEDWRVLAFNYATAAEAVVRAASEVLYEDGVIKHNSNNDAVTWNNNGNWKYGGWNDTPPSSEDVQLLLKRVAERLREAR